MAKCEICGKKCEDGLICCISCLPEIFRCNCGNDTANSDHICNDCKNGVSMVSGNIDRFVYNCEDIFQLIENISGITKDDIRDKSRKRCYVVARQVFSFLVREKYNLSYDEIGLMINRDHSTVIHNCKMVTETLIHDKDFMKMYGKILKI